MHRDICFEHRYESSEEELNSFLIACTSRVAIHAINDIVHIVDDIVDELCGEDLHVECLI